MNEELRKNFWETVSSIHLLTRKIIDKLDEMEEWFKSESKKQTEAIAKSDNQKQAKPE